MDSTKALRKIQETELSILETISRFCDENGIRFFIDGGTLLGAVRHGGFIPWDDDIDIGMLREDYDKFCKLAEDGLPEGYSLHTSQNSKGYAALFAKVYKDGTVFENQEGRDAGSSMGIFVDVFPYDRLYEDGSLRRTQIKSASMAQRRCYLYHSTTISVPHRGLLGLLEKACCRILHRLERARVADPAVYQQMFDDSVPSSEKALVTSECLTLAWPNMDPFDLADIFPTVDVAFEGRKFPAPRKAEEYLGNMYGNWREVPKPEDRHTHLPTYVDFGDGTQWKAGE